MEGGEEMTDMTDVDRCHEAALASEEVGGKLFELAKQWREMRKLYDACPDRERPEGGI